MIAAPMAMSHSSISARKTTNALRAIAMVLS
jgi:hypothetical protein